MTRLAAGLLTREAAYQRDGQVYFRIEDTCPHAAHDGHDHVHGPGCGATPSRTVITPITFTRVTVTPLMTGTATSTRTGFGPPPGPAAARGAAWRPTA